MPPRTRGFAPPSKAEDVAPVPAVDESSPYLDALKRERDYYAGFGFEDRVPDVEAEIKRVQATIAKRAKSGD